MGSLVADGGAPRRLRDERERLGKSQRAFAELGGISKNTQLAYETGASSIPVDYLERLEEFGLDLSYVVTGSRTGEEPAPRKSRSGAVSMVSGPDLVQVPEIDPQFGLGAAFMDETAAPEMRTFSRNWLRQITTTPAEELYWARGRGNSMSATIEDGELVLIDRRQQSPRDADLIWAFAWGDVGAIKRLRPMPDGSVRILSDNPAVPPDVAHGSEIHIFGRVIAVVKNL